MKKLYIVFVLFFSLFHTKNFFAQAISILLPPANLKKRIRDNTGLQFLVTMFLLTFLLGGTVNAQWTPTNLGAGNINTVFVNGSDLLAGMNGGSGVLYTPDNGANWGSANTGMIQYPDVRAFAANAANIFTGTTDGVYRSSNTGTYTWAKVLDNVSCFSLLVNGSDIFAGTLGGGVYRSSDNGANWTQNITGLEAYPYVYCLASNGTYLFAGTYGAGGAMAQGVFRSSDNGTTWTQVNTGLTNTDVFSLAVKGGYLFAGTNGGVYRSSNNGSNWTFLAGGVVHTLKVVCGTDIYAGLLSSGGVSRSTDDGITWTSFSTGLPNTGGLTVMSLDVSSTYLFAGTLGGGVARSPTNCTTSLGSICGVKFNDLNGNGVRDAGEPGLPGWLINLSYNNTAGHVTLIDTTDASGNYCFNNLQGGGTYTVSETNQGGWQQTAPPSPGTYTVALAAGQNKDSLNFGNKLNHTGSCITWDLLSSPSVTSTVGNITGLPESMGLGSPTLSTGLPANLMSIYGYSSNGQELWVGNTGGTWVPDPPSTPLPDPARYIQFNVSPNVGNSYTVTNVSFNYGDDPNIVNFNILNFQAYYSTDGWSTKILLNPTPLVYLNLTMSTFNASGLNVPVASGQTFSLRIYMYPVLHGIAMAPTFAIHNNVVICGTTAPEVIKTGSICGMKFNDLNGNGVRDAGEPGLPNWIINLSYSNVAGHVTLIDTTDANGNYCFNNLQGGGTYTVSETNQSGWQQTAPSSPGTYTVALAAGQNKDSLNFGNKSVSSLGCVTPPSGMVAWWPLDETSGSTSIDLAGFNNSGTLVNSPVPMPAKVLGGLQFNGINNYVEVPDQSELNFGTGDFSFDAWIQTTDSVGAGDLVDKRTSTSGYTGYSFFINDGKLSLELATGTLTNYVPPVFVADGKWHHIAVTISRSNPKGILFYIDGVPTQFGDPTTHSGSLDVKGPLRIGSQSFSVDYLFKGILDEIELFNRVLTQQEIVSIYAAGSAGKCKTVTSLGSICGVKFNDLNGNGVRDAGEPGLPNWIINLSYSNVAGHVTLIDTTDANGNYCFNNLQGGGTYTVSETNQSGWQQTAPPSPGTYTVTLAAGQNKDSLNFGNKKISTLGCVTPPSGMVAWWPLDETSGTTSTDLAGFNNSGTRINGPVPVPAKVSGGLQFDGINDYISVPDHSELNFGTGNFSVDAWIKTSANTNLKIIVDKQTLNGYNYQGYSFYLNAGYLTVQLADGVPPTYFTNWSSSLFVADGNWHHVAVTVSRSLTNGIVFYKDGVASQFGDPTGRSGSLTTTSPLTIGRQSYTDQFEFNGVLDEIELFNRVLTQQEIVTIFAADSAGKCKPTVQDSCSSKIWTPLGTGINNGTNGEVWALAVIGSDLYVGGNFTTAGGNTANHIAKWNGSSWSPLISSNSVNGINGMVSALAVIGTDLYAGGWFTVAGGVPAENIAKWDGTNWSALGNGLQAAGAINALAAMGNNLYATSYILTPAIGGPGNLIVKWDGANWSAFSVMNDYVSSFLVNGSDLYTGGQFTIAGTVPANHIAKWDGTNWSPVGLGTNYYIGGTGLKMMGGNLYAGGRFTLADNNPANFIAKWDGSNWSPFLSGSNNGMNNSVEGFAVMGTDLYASGSFTTAEGVSANSVAKWDGTNWSPLGSGMNDGVWRLAVIGDDLYAGGIFTTAGGVSAKYIAKYSCGMSTTAGVDKPENSLPQRYKLEQNYPNPFNPTTQITFEIPSGEFVSLRIFNMLGQQVAVLVNEQRPAGAYSVTFRANNLPSGMYFYRLIAGQFQQTRKLLLLK